MAREVLNPVVLDIFSTDLAKIASPGRTSQGEYQGKSYTPLITTDKHVSFSPVYLPGQEQQSSNSGSDQMKYSFSAEFPFSGQNYSLKMVGSTGRQTDHMVLASFGPLVVTETYESLDGQMTDFSGEVMLDRNTTPADLERKLENAATHVDTKSLFQIGAVFFDRPVELFNFVKNSLGNSLESSIVGVMGLTYDAVRDQMPQILLRQIDNMVAVIYKANPPKYQREGILFRNRYRPENTPKATGIVVGLYASQPFDEQTDYFVERSEPDSPVTPPLPPIEPPEGPRDTSDVPAPKKPLPPTLEEEAEVPIPVPALR